MSVDFTSTFNIPYTAESQLRGNRSTSYVPSIER
jgi:hypothetical protein